MLKNVFNRIDLLKNSMDYAWKKNELISNNIANVNTPGYKRMTIEFNDLLNSKLKKKIDLKTTNEKHFENINNNDRYKIKRDKNLSTRKDGNNVNIDIEMAELIKNTLFYNTLSTKISNDLNKIKMVIKEGR